MTVRFSFSIQKLRDSVPKNRLFPDLALPNNHHAPVAPAKRPLDLYVSRPVLREFWLPKRALRSRLPVLPTAVLVPEAPMHEDYLLSGAKHKIRITRQFTRVEAIAVTHAMDKQPNNHLRLGIDISDTRHPFASLCRSQRIVSRHYSVPPYLAVHTLHRQRAIAWKAAPISVTRIICFLLS
jgi:hypothetical protein